MKLILDMKNDKKYIQERIEIDDETGCWNWKLSLGSHGYGNTKYCGKNNRYACAHRLSYYVYRGEIGKYHVLHTCDNRKCCNPEHLYLGTDKENCRDRILRGTHRNGGNRGEEIGTAKVTEKQVREIKIRLKNGETPFQISKDYPIGKDAIYRIKWGRRWTHVEI